MRTTLRFSALIAALLCLATTVQAQTILVERADRPPSTGKNHFLTATQPFSLNVRVEGLNNIKGVFFEMQWTNAGAIRFDGWSADGAYAESELTVPPVRTNQANGTGSISVAAQLANPVGRPGLNDHTVIRLNFIGAANAVHNSRVRFSFTKPEAVVGNIDRSIERLVGISKSYDVHGFVDVWPGDANNDRVVDHSDWSVISQFFDDGDPAGRIRGFARDPASTIWAAQRALSWDSVRVTYADADGSGRVDNTDFLVVMANFDRIHVGAVKKKDDEINGGSGTKNFGSDKLNATYSIPVTVESDEIGLGLAGRISWAHLPAGVEVVGITNGEVFLQPGGQFVDAINNDTRSVSLAIGHFYPHPGVRLNGTVAYLQVESATPLEQNLSIKLDDARGITRNRGIFALEGTVSSADETETSQHLLTLSPNPADDIVRIAAETSETIESIEVFNLRGEQKTAVAEVREQSVLLHTSGLVPGAYIVRVHTRDGATNLNLRVLR